MIQEIDLSLLLWIQKVFRVEALDPFWKLLSFLADNGWFWMVLGLVLAVLAGTRKAGVTVLLALGIGAMITNVCLKPLAARMRPYDYSELVLLLVQPLHDYSFPSGHSCASFAGATACLCMTPKKWGIGAMVLAGLIAFSRLYVGAHFPTDVLAGTLIGVVSGLLSAGLVRKRNKQKTAISG